MKIPIPPKVLFTVFGVVAAGTMYVFGYRPYQEEKRMMDFESEAKALFEMRRRRQEQSAEFKSDANYK